MTFLLLEQRNVHEGRPVRSTDGDLALVQNRLFQARWSLGTDAKDPEHATGYRSDVAARPLPTSERPGQEQPYGRCKDGHKRAIVVDRSGNIFCFLTQLSHCSVLSPFSCYCIRSPQVLVFIRLTEFSSQVPTLAPTIPIARY